MKYAWAAYKAMGGFDNMGETFMDGSLDKLEFRDAFLEEILKYDAAWTVMMPDGKRAAGIHFGKWAHPLTGVFIHGGPAIWMPWASARVRIESAVHFYREIAKHVTIVEIVEMDIVKFFEVICRHGVMRRIGTTYSIQPGKRMAIFESRRIS